MLNWPGTDRAGAWGRHMPASRRRSIALSLGIMLGIGVTVPVQAQDYPNRPLRLITDSGPGSAVDSTNRIIADALGRVLGQQVLVINQPGAGGALAARDA